MIHEVIRPQPQRRRVSESSGAGLGDGQICGRVPRTRTGTNKALETVEPLRRRRRTSPSRTRDRFSSQDVLGLASSSSSSLDNAEAIGRWRSSEGEARGLRPHRLLDRNDEEWLKHCNVAAKEVNQDLLLGGDHDAVGAPGEDDSGRRHAEDPPIRPESGEPAYWPSSTSSSPPSARSRRDPPDQLRGRRDGIAARSVHAICGSCGGEDNGAPRSPATRSSGDAAERANDGAVVVEPMGNMPVLKDLITDMDAVHWKKVRRVVPWLLPDEAPPRGPGVHRPRRVDDRRHPGDGLHPLRSVRSVRGLVDGGRSGVRGPRRPGQGPPLRRRLRATASTRRA